MRAEVFYHTTPERDDAMAPFGFGREGASLSGGMYRFVTSGPAKDDSELSAEGIYRAMNVVNGDELPTRLGCRSMCVGDILVFRDGDLSTKVYVVRNVGFERVALTPEVGSRTFKIGGGVHGPNVGLA